MLNNKRSKNNKGQSLLYVSFLIVILISGVFFVYDIGNMVNTKIKFQNGADAAVLSSVALKISKHHTDQMIRTSMYHESVAAQAEQRAAQALLVQIILSINTTPQVIDPMKPLPGGGGIHINAVTAPPNVVQPTQPAIPSAEQKQLAGKYKGFVNKTYRHVIKLHRERKALEAYYQWLSNDNTGITANATTEIARIALRSNTMGLISAKNIGLAENL
ncbi:MAG: Tad domain-containing protein, partial [Candidatus Sericytochromatia bacterium]|nr:Tad domain-containing protein [Candidatus Sericytochromatia bacterium]